MAGARSHFLWTLSIVFKELQVLFEGMGVVFGSWEVPVVVAMSGGP